MVGNKGDIGSYTEMGAMSQCSKWVEKHVNSGSTQVKEEMHLQQLRGARVGVESTISMAKVDDGGHGAASAC